MMQPTVKAAATASFPIRPGVAVALLVLCALFWGSNAVIGRALYEDVPPVGLSFWRNVFALLVLVPFTRRELRSHWPSLRDRLGVLLWAGLVGMALFNAVLYLALHTTTAINAALIMSLSPVIIPFFAWLLLRERMSTTQLVGILVSLAGVVLMITRGQPTAVVELGVHRGDVLALLAAICWALYSVVVKFRPASVPPLVFLAAILVVAVLSLLPFYIWESLAVQPMPADAAAWVAAVYVGVFPTTVALWMFNLAVDRLGPIRAGLFTHLVPVFSALLAIGFLDERLQWFQLAGAIPIALGLYLVTFAGAPSTGGESGKV
jgi:drug/metabolite transporter (DMT)-like permease